MRMTQFTRFFSCCENMVANFYSKFIPPTGLGQVPFKTLLVFKISFVVFQFVEDSLEKFEVM